MNFYTELVAAFLAFYFFYSCGAYIASPAKSQLEKANLRAVAGFFISLLLLGMVVLR